MKNKIVIVGTGMVGSSYAYSLITQGLVDEIVLINNVVKVAEAQAADLIHGTNFLPKQPKIYSGTYKDCRNAKIVCVTAGAAQKQGQSRLDLVDQNAQIMKSIVNEIKANDFRGILLIASNPVDVMTYVAYQTSGYISRRVISSGTVLDTARFRYNISKYLDYSSTQVHANIIGEHGDSSLPVWSIARIENKLISDMIKDSNNKYNFNDLDKCFIDARDAAYDIIQGKGSTYYGIGTSLSRITKAILNDENSILTIGSYLKGEYGINDIYLPLPSVLNRAGVREILEVKISDNEKTKLLSSAKQLKVVIDHLKESGILK